MKTAYVDLIKTALNMGLVVSVWDGEEWQVMKSTNIFAIVDAVKSVEEATIRFRNTDGEKVGSAFVSAYGLEPDETVIDHTDIGWMNTWFNDYINSI